MRPPIRRIVAGVAAPRAEDPALLAALRLSARLGAELDLLHVHASDPGPGAPLAAALREVVERVEPGATATGRVVCRVLPGPADQRLLEVAAHGEADLLMLGATRRGVMAGALLGTTAGRVLRGARTPILVVHEPLPEGRPLRVLLTTDLSHHAAYAHSRGGGLAARLSAGPPEARSLYVQPPLLPDEPVSRAEAEAAALRDLTEFLRAEVPPPTGTPCVRSGDPASEIVAEAREWNADLLVMGTHGRRGAVRLFLGSVAETVLRHAPCATLVMPPIRRLSDDATASDRDPAPARVEVAAVD